MKSPQLDKYDEVYLAATTLVDVLQSPTVSPLFKDKNYAVATLKQLSEIFMINLQSTVSSDAAFPVTINNPTVANPSSPRVTRSSSPKVRFPSPLRAPITLESARNLRA